MNILKKKKSCRVTKVYATGQIEYYDCEDSDRETAAKITAYFLLDNRESLAAAVDKP